MSEQRRTPTGPQRDRDEALMHFGFPPRPVITAQEVEQRFIDKVKQTFGVTMEYAIPEPRQRRLNPRELITLFLKYKPDATQEQQRMFTRIYLDRWSCFEYVRVKGWQQITPPLVYVKRMK